MHSSSTNRTEAAIGNQRAFSSSRSTTEDGNSEVSEHITLPPDTIEGNHFNNPSASVSSSTRVLQDGQDEAPDFFTPPVRTIEDYFMPEASRSCSTYTSVSSHVLQDYMTGASSAPSPHGISITLIPPSPALAPSILLSSLTPSISRFWCLFHHINALLHAVGCFHSSKGRFTRTTDLAFWTTAPLADRRVRSYAAADVAIDHAEHFGRLIMNADLLLFDELSKLSWTLLEQIEAAKGITIRDWAWGVLGLAAGWVGPNTPFLEKRKARLKSCLRTYEGSEECRAKTLRHEAYRTGTVLLLRLRANRRHVRSLFVLEVVAAWLRGVGRGREEGKKVGEEEECTGVVSRGGDRVVLSDRLRKDYWVEYAAVPLPA